MRVPRDFWLALLLIAATALAYAPAYQGNFLWDDDRHISRNRLLESTRGLERIWFDLGATPQYYPLTHTSFWIEWQLWGDAVVGYHVVNAALHVIASLVVVTLLKRLAVPGAWLAGFVFALHPLHVESVAWMSERKNTLSIVFWLLSIVVYLPVAALSGKPRSAWHWWGAFGLFLCAVLSKTIACSMPAVMLVLIWWKRGRIGWRDVKPLVPFFVVAVIAAMVTGRMERDVVGAEGADWGLSFTERTLVAGRAIWWYASKVVWPSDLAFSYERWTIDARAWWQWAFVASAVLFLLLLGLSCKRLGRGPLAAALIFGGTLLPALGYFNLYPHRFSFVADHFQYHSNVAAIAVLCGAIALFGMRAPTWARASWCTVLAGLLATMTFGHSKVYKDQETLWRDTIAKTPSSWLAHHNLGVYLSTTRSDRASLEEALTLLERAKQLRPQHERVEWSMAEVLRKLGREAEAQRQYERAIAQYRWAVANEPKSPNGYARLAAVYDAVGRSSDALDVLISATRSMPDNAYFLQQAASRLLASQRGAEAIPLLERWTELQPDQFEARMRLAYAYGLAGRSVEAREQFKQAARLDPFHPDVVRGFDLAERSLIRSAPATAPAPVDEMLLE